MKRTQSSRLAATALVLVLIIGVGSAAAQQGESRALRSFAPPGDWPYGIDYVEASGGLGTLYHADYESGDVYSITTGGSATLLFNVPTSIGHPSWTFTAAAICFVGDADNQSAGTLYILEPDRGSSPYYTIVRSFSMDGAFLDEWDLSAIVNRGTGIAYDGSSFWLVGYADLVQCDSDFNLIQSHVVPWGVSGGGLDFDASTNLLYNLSTNFDAVVCFERGAEYITHEQYIGYLGFYVNVPDATIGHVTRESRTLWIVNNTDIPSVIMEINDDYYDPVESTSWGAIKALYR